MKSILQDKLLIYAHTKPLNVYLKISGADRVVTLDNECSGKWLKCP
jgi:hypothetical protein